MATISGRASVCALVAGMALAATAAAAQVTLDGSANREFSGPLRPKGGEFRIGARLGRLAGKNLFHSFDQFDLREGERATFRGPAQVANIISRVTGGEHSDIDGTIRSTIGGADFYFLNPAGIVFGPNASLDLKGSFHVSTADELRFADGAIFSASNSTASSFTVAAPQAFGFLGRDRGAVSVQDSRLRVRPGEAVSLVGGEVTIAGGSADIDNPTIEASRGTVTVGAVGVGGGQFTIRSGQLEAPDRGAVTISDGAFLDTTGNGAGLIRIRGGRVVIRGGSSIFSNNDGNRNAPARNGINIDAEVLRVRGGSALTADVVDVARGSGGDVVVRADVVALVGDSALAANTFASGNAGSVRVNAGRRLLVQFSNILSSSLGVPGFSSAAGNAGQVRVTVSTGDIELVRSGQIISNTEGVGNAGSVQIVADTLTIREQQPDTEARAGIFTQTNASGNAGEVTVEAREVELAAGIISSDTLGSGNGGEINITSSEMILAEGAQISSSATSGGNAGGVSIQVAERLSLRGAATISSSALQRSRGNGGEVRVSAGEIDVLDGSQIRSDARGSGNAGQISIRASNALTIVGSPETFTGVFSEVFQGALGNAGSIIVTVLEGSVEVMDDGGIGTSTFGAGNAGDIVITADRVIGRSAISSDAAPGSSGRAGTVTVIAREVQLLGNGVVSSSTSGQGDAGTVSIAGERLVLSDRGRVGSESVDGATGNAGEVAIDASEVEILDGGQITATTSGSGLGGDVRVEAGQIMATGDGSAISSGAEGSMGAAGGTVVVIAQRAVLVLDGAEIRASTSGGADAGSVDVRARQIAIEGEGSAIASEALPGSRGASGDVTVRASEITVRDGGDISSSNQGAGPAGSVTIGADRRLMLDGGRIRTASASAGGGELIIRGAGLVDVHRSQISTEVSGGDNPVAGNIAMDPQMLLLDSESVVRASAPGGAGGNIQIQAGTMIVPGGDRDAFLRTGVIDASGETEELAGTVAVNAPEIDLSGGLVALEGALLDASSLLRERCGERRDVGASSFTGVGRGGLPPSPDGPLGSSYEVAEAGEADRPAQAAADGGGAELAAADAGFASSAPCRGVL